MRCSVIIPTRGGAEAGVLPGCVDALLAQAADDEVIVCVDGHEPPAGLTDPRVRVLTGERGGPGAARNRGLEIARGEVVLFLNDDVTPGDGLLDGHAGVHADRRSRGAGPAMVLGSAPFAVASDDRVIDRLTRETSLIFFYDQMDGSDPGRDWGFRHAWTLNLSVAREACPRFDDRLAQPMFDDLEWAFRAAEGGRVPVLFRPGCSVTHHHRYSPRAMLRREALLGHQAVRLHATNPACASAVFGESFTPGWLGARGEGLDARREGAREAFAAFCDMARQAASTLKASDRVDAAFRACRSWREPARLFGALRAARGVDARSAMEEGLAWVDPGREARWGAA